MSKASVDFTDTLKLHVAELREGNKRLREENQRLRDENEKLRTNTHPSGPATALDALYRAGLEFWNSK